MKAIIGVLSAVAVVQLNSVRRDSIVVAAQQSMDNVRTTVIEYMSDGYPLYSNGPGTNCWPPTNWVSGTVICGNTTAVWPEVPDDINIYNRTCAMTNMDDLIFTYTIGYGDGAVDPNRQNVNCNLSGCTVWTP